VQDIGISEIRETATEARRERSDAWLIYLLRLLVVVVVIGAWHYSVVWGLIPEFYISTPWKTLDFLVTYLTSRTALIDAAYTISEMLAGFLSGSAVGITTGLLMARYTIADRVFSPFLYAFNSLPKVALAPIFILWLGIGPASKIVLAFASVFFITLINTQAGAKSTDRDLLMMSSAMGATQHQSYVKVVLPYAIPSIFAGLKLSAIYALLATVVGEMLSAQHGWGRQITYYSQTFEVSGMFGILFILATFSVSLNFAMVALENWLLRWRK
jgi:NitT/TauT family transport system permease protein